MFIFGWASHLDAFSGYPVPTSLPRRCRWRDNRYTSGQSVPVLFVLGTAPLNTPTPTTDTDRTVSRRSEPSSCTALTGEQPDPWDLLQPQDAISRHRGAKPPRRCELSGAISLLSPAYLLSVERRPLPIRNRRITKAYFRTCSTCPSRSQAPLCLYTLRAIADRAEGTFARLRYSLGGDRPSQTTRLPRSPGRLHSPGLEPRHCKGGISPAAPHPLARVVPSLPPMLHVQSPDPIAGYSKGCTGSFCPVAGNRYPHRYSNFTELAEETAPKSLRHSCRSELTRQGISLP